ncbi:hypothetical protein POSPLADRAFT_1054708 [Postia placenta MAD-698-R-SB12]|uniref:Uncharacterized protein n=1 Tax=Postia placenta MAD-698-R-SB12 TaxID=670580 RepID=A0A1X6N647_9APHY|nr:hypothetical protein POSPLADRAFT_1054708 [Postia placenta MAD-698-R-SB12]OSX64091.1 hypothetical protein POSPLADRAFT_1054708 [Postia placenta MAD-698-R-SB12]
MSQPHLKPARPKEVYRDRNGFVEPINLRISGQVPVPNLHVKPTTSDPNVKAAYAKSLRNGAERRRFAEDVLLLKGSYFPGWAFLSGPTGARKTNHGGMPNSVEAARELDAQRETSDSVQRSIDDLKARHKEEMQTLYDWQADDYFEEARQACFSKDEEVTDPNIDTFYHSLHTPHPPMVASFDNAVSAHRYAYLSTLKNLTRQHAGLTREEEDRRRRADAQFPASLAEYRTIRSKDTQLRIARFLTADNTARDKMMDEFQWVWRQVKPLIDEYESNTDFKLEVQASMRQVETHDPRRKA